MKVDQPSEAGEYDAAMQTLLRLLWDEGFLSPGGAAEVACLLEGSNIAGCSVLDIGCGLGAVDELLFPLLEKQKGIRTERELEKGINPDREPKEIHPDEPEEIHSETRPVASVCPERYAAARARCHAFPRRGTCG